MDNLTHAQRGGMPNVNTHHVIGVFDDSEAAAAAELALEQAQFQREALSLMAAPPGSAPRMGAGETSAKQGALKGAVAGAAIGGLVMAALTVPGFGVLIAAGPLIATISGGVMGGTLGGVVGSFIGLGMTSEQAQEYEAMIRDGAIVLDVVVPGTSQADQATAILRQHGAHHVMQYAQHL